MPMELDLAPTALASEPVTASRTISQTVEHATSRPRTGTAHETAATALPAFRSHPLTRQYPHSVAAPRAGELHLWRFRCEWLPVPVQEGDTWLSKAERERARLHPNAALRKRFISARVVVRWIVGNLFECEPQHVELQDDGNEKLRARHPHDGRGITIDIVYGGIWIVIGMASATLGLSVVTPSPGSAPDESSDAARRRARYSSLCNASRYAPVDIDGALLLSDRSSCALELGEHGYWYVLDLPMGGKIRAAVAIAQQVTMVHTFGWPKGVVFDRLDS